MRSTAAQASAAATPRASAPAAARAPPPPLPPREARASLCRRERFGARVELPLQSVLIGVERLDHRARALRLVRRLFGATAFGGGGVLRLAASRLRVARPRLRRLELLHQILARRVKPGDERFQLVHLALRLIELATLRARSLGVSAEHLARLAERLSRRLCLGDGVVAFGGGHLKFADARGASIAAVSAAPRAPSPPLRPPREPPRRAP